MYKLRTIETWNGIEDTHITDLPTGNELIAVIVKGMTRKQEVQIDLDSGLEVPILCNARDNGGVFFLGIDTTKYGRIRLTIRKGKGRNLTVQTYERTRRGIYE